MAQQKAEETPKRNPNLLFGIAGNAKGFNYDIPFEYAVEGMHATSAIREVILKNLSNEINELRFDLGADYNKYEAEITKTIEENSDLVREYAAGNKTFEQLKGELLKDNPDPAKEKVLKIMMLSMTSDLMLASTRAKAEDQDYRQSLEGVLNNSDGVTTFIPLMMQIAKKDNISTYEKFVFAMAAAKTLSFKVGLPSMMLKVAAFFSDTLKASDAAVTAIDAVALGASSVLCGISAICCLSVIYRLNGVRKKLNVEREVRADILNEFQQQLGEEFVDAKQLSTKERKELMAELLETAPDKMSERMLKLKEKDPVLFYQKQAKLLENKNLILSRKSKRKDLIGALGVSVVTLGLSILAVAFPPAAIAATVGIVAISVGKFLYNIFKRNKANKKKMKAARKAALDANHNNINNKLKPLIESVNKLYPGIKKEVAALKERFDKGQITSKELLEEYRKLIEQQPEHKALNALQAEEAQLSKLIDGMKEDGFPTDKLEDELAKVQQQIAQKKEVSQLDSYLQSLEAESQALDDTGFDEVTLEDAGNVQYARGFIKANEAVFKVLEEKGIDTKDVKERILTGGLGPEAMTKALKDETKKLPFAARMKCKVKSASSEQQALYTMQDEGKYQAAFLREAKPLLALLEMKQIDTKALKEGLEKGTISSDEVISKFEKALQDVEPPLSPAEQDQLMTQVTAAHEQATHVTKFNKHTAASAEPSPVAMAQPEEHRETASVSSELQDALSEHSEEFEEMLEESMSNDSMDSVGYSLSAADSEEIDRLIEWEDNYNTAVKGEVNSSLRLLETMHVDTTALRQGLKDGTISSKNLISEFESVVAESGLSEGVQGQMMNAVKEAHEKAAIVADGQTGDLTNDSLLSEVPSLASNEPEDELVLDDVDQDAAVRAAML